MATTPVRPSMMTRNSFILVIYRQRYNSLKGVATSQSGFSKFCTPGGARRFSGATTNGGRSFPNYHHNHHHDHHHHHHERSMDCRRPSRFSFGWDRCQETRRTITVPTVIESGTMGERAFDLYSRLLRERIICVHGQITDDMCSLVSAQLLFLEAEAPKKPLFMYINSPGGSTTAALAIYDTMQYIQPQVHTICMGQASSIASLLLTSGEPNCRFALPNSSIMLHQPYGGVAQGMASDINIHAQELLSTRSIVQSLYAKHAGRPIEVVERTMDRTTFMDVSEAIDFGIIDSVLDKRTIPTSDDDEKDGES